MAQADRLFPSGSRPPSRNAPLASHLGRLPTQHVHEQSLRLSQSLPELAQQYRKQRPSGTTTMPAGAPAPLPGAPGGGSAPPGSYPAQPVGGSSTTTTYGAPDPRLAWQGQVYQQTDVPVNVNVVTQPQLSNSFVGQPASQDLGPMVTTNVLGGFLSGRCLAYAAFGVLLAVVFSGKNTHAHTG